jgi:hypothetical protein
MQLDLESLRQHYASLSDAALLEMDRADLVEMAQQCYDVEMARRKLGGGLDYGHTNGEAADFNASRLDVPSGWRTDAALVYSATVVPGRNDAPEAANARDALEAAGIPCSLEVVESPDDKRERELKVPGKYVFLATNIIDRDIFNAEFEQEWKAHLENLPTDELRSMEPHAAFCGLYDKIERINRVYNVELIRRGLK